MKLNFQSKKVLIILIFICFILSCVFQSMSSEMYAKSESLEKKVKELKVNRTDSEYILKSDAEKNDIPCKRNSTIMIDGKKYCEYFNTYNLYATPLLYLSIFCVIGLVLCTGKLATLIGHEIGNKENVEEHNETESVNA